MANENPKPIDPVEERDIQKFLEILKEPRIRKALLEAVDEEYDRKLDNPEEK